MMKQEIKDLDLELVSGGNYHYNANTKKIVFDNGHEILKVRPNYSIYQAIELCDSLIGQYPTTAEYDAACISLLKNKGLVDVVGTY